MQSAIDSPFNICGTFPNVLSQVIFKVLIHEIKNTIARVVEAKYAWKHHRSSNCSRMVGIEFENLFLI